MAIANRLNILDDTLDKFEEINITENFTPTQTEFMNGSVFIWSKDVIGEIKVSENTFTKLNVDEFPGKGNFGVHNNKIYMIMSSEEGGGLIKFDPEEDFSDAPGMTIDWHDDYTDMSIDNNGVGFFMGDGHVTKINLSDQPWDDSTVSGEVTNDSLGDSARMIIAEPDGDFVYAMTDKKLYKLNKSDLSIEASFDDFYDGGLSGISLNNLEMDFAGNLYVTNNSDELELKKINSEDMSSLWDVTDDETPGGYIDILYINETLCTLLEVDEENHLRRHDIEDGSILEDITENYLYKAKCLSKADPQ